MFIYTPRGRNHGLRLLETARKSHGWFHEVLTVANTGILAPEILRQQRQELYDLYGPDYGEAMYQQPGADGSTAEGEAPGEDGEQPGEEAVEGEYREV